MQAFKQNTKSEHNSKLKKILHKMPTFYSNHAKSDFNQREDKSFHNNQKQNEQIDLQSFAGEIREKQNKYKIKSNNQTPKVLKEFRMFKRSLKQLDIQKNKQNRRRNYSQKYLDKNLQTKSLGRHKNNKIQDIKHKIQLDKQKHPKKYRILKNLGYSQDQVFRMKSQDLNEKLNEFIKNKGLEYLRQDKEKAQSLMKRSKTQPIEHLQTIKEKLSFKKIIQSKKQKNNQQSSQRYQVQINNKYFPQIYQELRVNRKQAIKKSKSNQSINSLRQKHNHQKLIKNLDNNQFIQKSLSKKLESQKKNKKQSLALIRRKQDILGKIVFDKVKTHLKIKQKPNYFQRVKSEENVDGALIQFLKMKINRAEITLK